jgi:hypothetical protein
VQLAMARPDEFIFLFTRSLLLLCQVLLSLPEAILPSLQEAMWKKVVWISLVVYERRQQLNKK